MHRPLLTGINYVASVQLRENNEIRCHNFFIEHYNDVMMGAIPSQINSLTIVYSNVYSGADKKKHQRSASLAICEGNSPGTGEIPHKGPVMRKMFPFDDVIMKYALLRTTTSALLQIPFLSQRHENARCIAQSIQLDTSRLNMNIRQDTDSAGSGYHRIQSEMMSFGPFRIEHIGDCGCLSIYVSQLYPIICFVNSIKPAS